jgi:hypothetical protein
VRGRGRAGLAPGAAAAALPGCDCHPACMLQRCVGAVAASLCVARARAPKAPLIARPAPLPRPAPLLPLRQGQAAQHGAHPAHVRRLWHQQHGGADAGGTGLRRPGGRPLGLGAGLGALEAHRRPGMRLPPWR